MLITMLTVKADKIALAGGEELVTVLEKAFAGMLLGAGVGWMIPGAGTAGGAGRWGICRYRKRNT